MTASKIKITECPRDAMQGLHDFIPTELKAAYINLLLQVGFDTIDFGSFVSAKAIPNQSCWLLLLIIVVRKMR
jgi:hydroxymethylglutaryl-CoA lyase